jgi:hypothetical protein
VVVVASLIWTSIAVAAGPRIASVTFTGTNADLTITISGSGFGQAPLGVPCKSCATPYLNIGGRIGCSDAYNIASWKDQKIILRGFQGNPGGNVIVAVENPQNRSLGVFAAMIPTSVVVASSPTIQSVVFSGSGRNLHLIIIGSGFGNTPPGVPGNQNSPFFAFIDHPFNLARQWVAGYTSCGGADAVTLKYASWSARRIVISGFGSNYGKENWEVKPGDIVAIAIANSGTNGLKMSYNFAVYSPLGTGSLWVGPLP